MVVREQAAVDLQRLLAERLGLGVLPLGVERVTLPIHVIGRLIGDSILVRHRGHPVQGLDTPLRVHRLEMLRPLSPRSQGDCFLCPRNRLVQAIGLQGLVDLFNQLLGSFLVVAGQLAQSQRGGSDRPMASRRALVQKPETG